MICGIDEVGRGPWAGPLVVGAVVLNGASIEGLTDSKKLSKAKRETIARAITASSASIGLGWVHASELDEIGMSASLVEATKRAIEQINTPYHEIIIDGTVNFLAATSKGSFVTTLKKADLLIKSVSAASIIAKVARDEYMTKQALLYPQYGFAAHMGYGTAQHREAIKIHGVTALHRLSFAPLAKYKDVEIADVPKATTYALTAKNIGDTSESIATAWLASDGFVIVERNWKTSFCEIDIVARRMDKLYFVEVKHRKTAERGGGVAAVTPQKLRKMIFASNVYVQYHRLHEVERQLAVLTTAGDAYVFESFTLLDD